MQNAFNPSGRPFFLPPAGSDRMTVIADASWCPDTQVAGWSGWFRCGGMRAGQFASGPLKQRVLTATQAELAAVANTLVTAKQRGYMVYVEELLIQSDSLGALRVLLTGLGGEATKHGDDPVVICPTARELHDFEVSVVAAIRGCVPEATRLRYRHVRGHMGGETGRSWVNETCDRRARQSMRAARELFNKGGVNAALRGSRRRGQ